jgi:hypothetical protein
MPTIDGGHIFLTLLIPVRTGGEALPDGRFVPHSHLLREELALLPTAQQSPETVEAGLVSPFARCRRTHFLRLVVIDQPMWNGRDPIDPLLNIALKRPLKAQPPFDVLSRPWLLLAADIDRTPGSPDDGLADWCAGLWERSRAEMEAIFSHCHGFEELDNAADFAAWLKRCQVETTMSFNGYYDGEPMLKGANLKALLAMIVGIAAGVTLLASLLVSGWWLVLVGLLGLGLGLYAAYARVAAVGMRAFPAFPDSDLATVLKSLWLQQRFVLFAEAEQHAGPEALHAAFATFLEETRPSDIGPERSQAPGVVRSDHVPLPRPPRAQFEALRP